MDIYDSLFEAVRSEYDTLTLIKKSERGEVSLIRHRDSGTRYIFKYFYGSSEVYRKLLSVSCSESAKDHGSRGKRWTGQCFWKSMCRAIRSVKFCREDLCQLRRQKRLLPSVVFSIMGAPFYGGGAPGCKAG